MSSSHGGGDRSPPSQGPAAQEATRAQCSPASDGRSLERLRELLLAEGGLIGGLVGSSSAEVEDGPAQLAAAGPRAKGRSQEYELLIEAIYEGYLLHFGSPRVVLPPSGDLSVLAGDRLYALGLNRLVLLGDIDAVAELADVITLTALAHADARPDLADAVWQAGARAVGWGSSPAHERAKALVRGGASEALVSLRGLIA
jgi:hypothetical protein